MYQPMLVGVLQAGGRLADKLACDFDGQRPALLHQRGTKRSMVLWSLAGASALAGAYALYAPAVAILAADNNLPVFTGLLSRVQLSTVCASLTIFDVSPVTMKAGISSA